MLRNILRSTAIQIAPRFANAVLFIAMAAISGPAQAGVLALAATFLIIFTGIQSGLDDLITREVVRRPAQASQYLVGFLLLRLALSLAAYAILLVTVLRIFQYPPGTVWPILILNVSILFDSLAGVGQAVLLGRQRFGEPALVLSIANLLRLGVGLVLLAWGQSINAIAISWVAASSIGMIGMLSAAFRYVGTPHGAASLALLRESLPKWLPFLSITVLITLESQTDILLLSAFHGESTVAWYNAATTVTSSIGMLGQAYRLSLYPLIVRYIQEDSEKLHLIYQGSLRYLAIIAVPVASGIALTAPRIVALAFGPRFGPTVLPLQILAFSLVFVLLNIPNARIILASDHQKRGALFLGLSLFTNLALNIGLDRHFGATGAAVARLCSSALFFVCCQVFVGRLLKRSTSPEIFLKPILAALPMATVVLAVKGPLLVVIAVAALTYVVALLLVHGIPYDDMVVAQRRVQRWCRLTPIV